MWGKCASAWGQVSPDERLVAWGEDRKGNEAFFLRVRDIATGKDIMHGRSRCDLLLFNCHLFHIAVSPSAGCTNMSRLLRRLASCQ